VAHSIKTHEGKQGIEAWMGEHPALTALAMVGTYTVAAATVLFLGKLLDKKSQ
jgi:hypothetical protein